MLSITITQLKSDITSKMKGTSLNQIKDFYGTAAAAANRMLSRIDTDETRRTVVMTTPFYDNIYDYALVTDYKRMIDIRPTADRQNQIGLSNFSETTPRQFDELLTPDSFSIRWNNMVRSIRAKKLPTGNVIQMDTFDATPTAPTVTNGTWAASGDISGIYSELLNYVQGGASMGFNLSGSTGTGYIENSTALVVDLSSYLYEDASNLFFWIPSGYSSKFTNFKLRRGDSSSTYREATVTTKADGTAFTDGWNQLKFDWSTASVNGVMTNTLNTYRRFTATTVAGTAIPGCLIDNWTNALGVLYEIEYYSECLFRTSAGSWLYTPTSDTDLVNVSVTSYEILKAEMMVDITQQIRLGAVQQQELTEWRRVLDGQQESRYLKNPNDIGLYKNYLRMFPSSAIVTRTRTYDFDL